MTVGLTLSNTALIASAHPWVSIRDTFDRTNASGLGTASDGTTWTVLTGNFLINDKKAMAGVTSASGTPADTAIAYVDTLRGNVYANESSGSEVTRQQSPASNVEITTSVSPVGGDAVYFRIKDANNWHRVLIKSVNVTDTVVNGYNYNWNSSRGSAQFISYFKDTKKYFPTLTTCQDTAHDHSTVAAPNEYITTFDPENRKWGPYPYIAEKRGISDERNSKGDDVRYLQGVLKYFGYTGSNNTPLTIDGNFGNETTIALKKLQREYKIVVDGFAWNLQSWLVIDNLAFDTLAVDTAGVRGSESITSYVRRVLLGSTYQWPAKVVVGQSSVINPPDSYTTITHTHDLLLDNCRHIVSLGAHTHEATNVRTNDAPTPISTTVTVGTKYQILIQKCVSGVVTDLPVTSFYGYDNLNTPQITNLKITVVDNYVGVSINNMDAHVFSSWGAITNPLLTFHGIGRGPSTGKGTGFNDFVCTPIESFVIPTQE